MVVAWLGFKYRALYLYTFLAVSFFTLYCMFPLYYMWVGISVGLVVILDGDWYLQCFIIDGR